MKISELFEAVAPAFQKFKKGQRVKVKKTGKEVTVLSQNDIGLVQTMTDDATKVDPKQKVVMARGYQEYMPRELELVSEAQLGSRVEFSSRKEWENALPSKHTLHKDGALERAQAIGKDFEGVAGTWDSNKNTGWIYAYYLKKSNLV